MYRKILILVWEMGYFFGDDLRSTSNKSKNRRDYIKLKMLLHSKGNNRVKKQSTEWEKIFENHTSDKGLIFKIYEEVNSIARRQITQFKNAQRIWRDISFEKYRYANGQDVHENILDIFISWIIKEMQIQITMRCHLTPVSCYQENNR